MDAVEDLVFGEMRGELAVDCQIISGSRVKSVICVARICMITFWLMQKKCFSMVSDLQTFCAGGLVHLKNAGSNIYYGTSTNDVIIFQPTPYHGVHDSGRGIGLKIMTSFVDVPIDKHQKLCILSAKQ